MVSCPRPPPAHRFCTGEKAGTLLDDAERHLLEYAHTNGHLLPATLDLLLRPRQCVQQQAQQRGCGEGGGEGGGQGERGG